jgi:RNA polymerase sigma-70 factor (ECF subfamily)
MLVLTFPMSGPADAGHATVDPRELSPAVVLRAAQGDPEASRLLWDHYAPPVRRFVRRMLGPDFDAGDLVQEIFLGVFAGLRRLRQREALRSFVFGVAANQVRLELRRRRVRAFFGRRAVEDEPGEAAPGDEDSLVAARRLYRALDRLAVRDRELVVLRFLEGLTLPEVAAQTRCSLATAKRHLDRAAEALALLAAKDPFLRGYLSGAGAAGAGANERGGHG